jgi:hypothetical protein
MLALAGNPDPLIRVVDGEINGCLLKNNAVTVLFNSM